MQDVVLNALRLPAVFEHGGQVLYATHTTTQTGADFGRVDEFVELVRVIDAGHDRGLSGANQRPQSSPVGPSNDISRDTVTPCVPTGWKPTSGETAELECLWDENTSALLEFDEPSAGFLSPNVALVAVLTLELLGSGFVRFDGLQIMVKLDFLMES